LDQVEKIAAKNVPSDRIFTEADFQIEFAEIKVGKPNLMEPPVYLAPKRSVGEGLSAQEIKA
jgi:hypothetical protein